MIAKLCIIAAISTASSVLSIYCLIMCLQYEYWCKSDLKYVIDTKFMARIWSSIPINSRFGSFNKSSAYCFMSNWGDAGGRILEAGFCNWLGMICCRILTGNGPVLSMFWSLGGFRCTRDCFLARWRIVEASGCREAGLCSESEGSLGGL